jgi:predicted MFS family arabinose efflux permease
VSSPPRREATNRISFRATDPRFIAISASLFVTAMGANAFSQFTIPYLVVVRGWPVWHATLALVVAFAAMPVLRLAYTEISHVIGDYATLLIGHVFYLLMIAFLLFGDGMVAVGGVGLSLGFGSALVFMAGPLQIMGLSSGGRAGWASGAFFATNFLAWMVAIPAYGLICELFGFAAGPYAAAGVTVLGALACATLAPRARTAQPELDWSQLRSLLTRPAIRSLAVLMLMSSFSFGFMFGTFATFVTTMYGAATMSFLAFAFYGVRLPASVVAGLTTDRLGPNVTLATTFAFAAAALTWSAWRFDLTTLVVAIGALGLIQAAVPVVGMSAVTVRIAPHARPLAFAPIMGAAEFGVGVTLALGLPLGSVRPDPVPFLWLIAAAYALCFGLLYLLRPLEAEPPSLLLHK